MESKGRIGVIIPHISSNVEIEFVDTVHKNAAAFGYDTIIISGAINYVDEMLDGVYCKGQTNIYDIILSGDFDGFIFEANIFCSEKQRKIILELLRQKNSPCVTVNYEQPYFTTVSADETALLYLSAMHLIKEHGCKKLYCIGGYKNHLPSEQRIDGFRNAMNESGLYYDDNSIFYGDYWRDVPHKVAVDIAEGKLEKPDGIVCGSDIMAVELCRTLEKSGIRVPYDIKVTGCDGHVFSQTEPVSITTAAGQERILGFQAVKKLLEMLGNDFGNSDIQPELIIGESCGCGENSGKFRNESLLSIREYSATIMELLEYRKTNSHGEIIRRMSECKNIYDVLATFIGCFYMIPTAVKAELCLCDDWCRDMNDPSVYRKSGFSDKIILGIENENNDTMTTFKSGDVFPSLTRQHKPRLIVLSSLHYKGQIFGYVGFTYKKAVQIIFDDFYMSWCDAVSSGLNTLQNHLYKEYINKKIEAFSEFAPVLGIYNKRGLISKLMSLLSENSNMTIELNLVSYVKEERVHYSVPPINSIVNAIRLNNSNFLLVSLNDDMIAVVKTKPEKISEKEFTENILKNVEKFFGSSVNISSERVYITGDIITSSQMFNIESIIQDLENKLKGKIISYGSGSFSYKDKFNELRNEIYTHPEKNWNIENILHSIGLSKSHFHRIYKELFGTNCKDDIISSRLDKVKWYLDNTTLSVAQISELCGYTNSTHLIRQFSGRTGITPSAYRKK